jgi:hypothetical protein
MNSWAVPRLAGLVKTVCDAKADVTRMERTARRIAISATKHQLLAVDCLGMFSESYLSKAPRGVSPLGYFLTACRRQSSRLRNKDCGPAASLDDSVILGRNLAQTSGTPAENHDISRVFPFIPCFFLPYFETSVTSMFNFVVGRIRDYTRQLWLHRRLLPA